MKTFLKHKVAWLGMVVMVLAGSCSDFEEINVNPNRVSYGSIKPTKLLQDIIYQGHSVINVRGFRLNSELIQYSIHTNALENASNYDIRANDLLQLWRGLYRWGAAASHMYDIAEKEEDANCMAIATTLKIYYAEYATAIFGDVPYSEAFMWEEAISTPRYDEQKDIYSAMLEELDDANFLYDLTKTLDYPSRDLLYGGDIAKWQKFTNSLRLRILMRVSKCAEINAAAQLKQMIENPDVYPVFESNEDAAILYYTGESPFYNVFGASGAYDGMHQNTRLGKTLTDIMNSYSDPRLPFYSDRRNGEYEGMLAGQPSDYISANTSLTVTYSTSLSTNTSPTTLFNYAEIMFIKAEAVLRGFISGDAKEYYEGGVTAAVRQWCGEDTNLDAMLNQTVAAYNGTLLQVMQQKYVAQFLVGFEAWCDYRRTGMPEMPTGPIMSNKDASGNPILPTRLIYPVITQSTNYDNYLEAVQRMGGSDNMQTKVWWAAGTNY